MVNKKRKFERGAAVAFISRNKALRKLQLSLSDFRRLCILKGIYPQEPRHPKKAGKGNLVPKTYYYTKDIQFLLHEPIVNKFRDYKIFVRKLRKAVDKKEVGQVNRLRKNKPKYTINHIIKERYPSLVDAIRDLDDALSLCFLYSAMPKNKKVHSEQVRLCRRLTVEFKNYIIASKSLRKVFISIKGFYFEVEILGQKVLWLQPHNLAYTHPADVDYRIMSTFAEFSCILLGFINFSLYKSLELNYPPQINLSEIKNTEGFCSSTELCTEILATLSANLTIGELDMVPDKFETDKKNLDYEKQRAELDEIEKLLRLFKDFKFFLNREVNREVFAFLIRSCGGDVSWNEDDYVLGSTYQEDDNCITHHVIDRNQISNALLSRKYIQPQWIADCINARRLLPTKDYMPGSQLPPHLSPFVVEEEGDYIPPEKKKLIEGNKINDEDESMSGLDTMDEDNIDIIEKKKKSNETIEKKTLQDSTVSAGKVQRIEKSRKIEEEKNEERKLAEMSIHKKNKRLYNKIKHLNKKKKLEVQILEDKRKKYDQEQKKNKKNN